ERRCNRLRERSLISFIIAHPRELQARVDLRAHSRRVRRVPGHHGRHHPGAAAEGETRRRGGHFGQASEEVYRYALAWLDNIYQHAQRLSPGKAAEHGQDRLFGGDDAHPEVAPNALDEIVHWWIVEGLGNHRHRVTRGNQRRRTHLPLAQVEGDEDRAAATLG